MSGLNEPGSFIVEMVNTTIEEPVAGPLGHACLDSIGSSDWSTAHARSPRSGLSQCPTVQRPKQEGSDEARLPDLLAIEGLTRTTAMVRLPCSGSSATAWEYHVQTLAMPNGAFKIRSLSGRMGGRLRENMLLDNPVADYVASVMHEELESSAMERGYHPLDAGELVKLQAGLLMSAADHSSRRGLFAWITLQGRSIDLQRYLSFCGDLSLEHQTLLASAKARAAIAQIAAMGSIAGKGAQADEGTEGATDTRNLFASLGLHPSTIRALDAFGFVVAHSPAARSHPAVNV